MSEDLTEVPFSPYGEVVRLEPLDSIRAWWSFRSMSGQQIGMSFAMAAVVVGQIALRSPPMGFIVIYAALIPSVVVILLIRRFAKRRDPFKGIQEGQVAIVMRSLDSQLEHRSILLSPDGVFECTSTGQRVRVPDSTHMTFYLSPRLKLLRGVHTSRAGTRVPARRLMI